MLALRQYLVHCFRRISLSRFFFFCPCNVLTLASYHEKYIHSIVLTISLMEISKPNVSNINEKVIHSIAKFTK
jgi:uncharacterized protein (DUF302 family)